MTLEEAVKAKVIDNESLAYFMGRSYLFLINCGISADGIRFRQHMANEMAHYACDCWDAEVETSYGWIEIAGHADRSCYDLSRHAQRTKTELKAAKMLKEPQLKKFVVVNVNKKDVGKTFKGDSKGINELIDSWEEEDKMKKMAEMESSGEIVLNVGGKEIKLSKDFVTFET